VVPSTATIGRRRAIPVPPQPTRSGLRPGTRSYQREHPYQDPTGQKNILVSSCKMNVVVLEKKNEGYEQQSCIFFLNSEDHNLYIHHVFP
jgi:hypothetical protein